MVLDIDLQFVIFLLIFIPTIWSIYVTGDAENFSCSFIKVLDVGFI